VYVYVYVYVHVYMYVLCICICVCVCTCIYVCIMYLYMYICNSPSEGQAVKPFPCVLHPPDAVIEFRVGAEPTKGNEQREQSVQHKRTGTYKISICIIL